MKGTYSYTKKKQTNRIALDQVKHWDLLGLLGWYPFVSLKNDLDDLK